MMFQILFDVTLGVIAYTDLKSYRIPDLLSGFIVLIGVLDTVMTGQQLIPDRLIGLITTPLLLVICNIFNTGAFGGGDIKLLAACGWFLGWKKAIVGLAVSIICCGSYCMAGIVLKKLKKSTCLAFGPFLCLGMFIAGLYGERIIIWYIN